MKARAILLFLLACAAFLQAAELSLNPYLSDNMVIQRDKPTVIRGMADKGAKVTVTFAGQTKTAEADENGAWSITLDAVPANSKPQTLTVVSSIKNQKSEIKNVLVGDVFLHARQTSIDISLGKDDAGKKAASTQKANPMFRAISIKTIPSAKPLNVLAKDATAGWSVVDKGSALKMTASAYYLGRDLAKDTDVPIGIVDLNLGSAFANSWLSRDALLETPKFFTDKEVAGQVGKYDKILEAEEKGEKIHHKHDGPPKNTIHHTLYPAGGYNGTLLPLSGTALKAVVLQLGNDYPYMRYQEIWDSGTPFDRPTLSKAYGHVYDIRKVGFRMESKVVPRITREWRQSLGDNDLPFGLIVPPGSDLNTLGQHHREMRELQRWVSVDMPNVGIILPGTQHVVFSSQPADEALLANRCLSWVEGVVYKKPDVVASGPVFDRFEANFNEATVHFKPGTAKGLKADGDALKRFEVANVEGDYAPAKATIDGETIRIESDTITRIMRVRYNWSKKPVQDLVNAAGLPAIPFRSERAPYHWFVRNQDDDLAEEYFLPANEWKKSDVTLINANLKNYGYTNFTGWIGPAGFKAGPFGPNMGVGDIKKGSPADGKLLPGDIIYSANGKLLGFKGYEVMAAAITESETRELGGKLVLGVRRGSENKDIELTLEVMGRYSTTAPYDCPKTEKIVANLERWVASDESQDVRTPDFLSTDTLFLLGTGNPKYQGLVRRAIYKKLAKTTIVDKDQIDPTKGPKAWFPAWDAMVLGEYYMATGDKNVLPYLKYNCDLLARKQHPAGGWRHNFPGGDNYGLMPALGVAGTIGFHIANDAGLDIDQKAYRTAVNYYLEQAHMGRVIYGVNVKTKEPPEFVPEKVDGGRMSTFNGAVASTAILADMEGDVRTAHLCSAISTYAFNNTYEGHGGNFWNNFWTPLGANVQGKKSYLRFWKNYRWYRECGRMYDGSLLGGGKIGAGYGIALVAPRQRLQIVGAPPSPFAADAPKALGPALQAYWKKDYAGCEKLVDELIAGGTVGLDDLPTVAYLGRAAKEMQLSFEPDFERIDALMAAGDLYGAKQFLTGLNGVMPVGDERLVAIQKKLANVPEPPKKKPQKKAPVDPTAKPRQWYCLVSDNQIKNPPTRDSRNMELVVNSPYRKKVPPANPMTANVWKIKVLEGMNQAPKDWYGATFDDSKWFETELPISWRMYHTVLLRTRFNVEDKSKFDALRFHSWILRQQGVEIYLNGELIGKVNNVGKLTTIEEGFKDSALKHLKNGENTLAITTRQDWRWGRSFMKVYNDGFDFNLDARLKE